MKKNKVILSISLAAALLFAALFRKQYDFS